MKNRNDKDPSHKNKNHTLPLFAHKYFWDVNPTAVNVCKHYFFVIERLVEYGDDDCYRWLFKTFTKEQIIETVKCSRNISRKTANMWANFYDIKREEIWCLSKSLTESGKIYWNY